MLPGRKSSNGRRKSSLTKNQEICTRHTRHSWGLIRTSYDSNSDKPRPPYFIMIRSKELTIIVLTTLYLLQGVLYGFQIQALPVLLRINGASQSLIGSIHLVAFPWLLKSFWAPFIDGRGAKNSLWLAASLWSTSVCLLGAQTENRALFLAAMFLLNVSSATMDLTLGQLLMSTFTAAEIPRISTFHIIGYKTGALIGGGMILWITAYLEKTNAILPVLSAVYCSLGIGVVWTSSGVTNPSHVFESKVRRDVTQFSTLIRSFFQTPGTWWVAGCVCAFKLTSHSAKTLFVMFLVDRGFTPSYIGFMSGTIGQLISIGVASGVGFLLSAKRVCAVTVLLGTALLSVSCVLLQLYTACWDVHQSKILLALVLQHIIFGAQATPLNTLMWQCSQNAPRALRTTHSSLLSTLETLSRQVAMFVAGVLAEMCGYCFALSVSFIASLIVLFLVYQCPNNLQSDGKTCSTHKKTLPKSN